jgi:hypothetical protein
VLRTALISYREFSCLSLKIESKDMDFSLIIEYDNNLIRASHKFSTLPLSME